MEAKARMKRAGMVSRIFDAFRVDPGRGKGQLCEGDQAGEDFGQDISAEEAGGGIEDIFEEWGAEAQNEGVPGASQGQEEASRARKWTSQQGLRGVPRYFGGVPSLDDSRAWKAKAARNISFRYARPARIAISIGGAVVAAGVAALAGGKAAMAAAILAMTASLALDPLQLFSRRIAAQSRALITVSLWILAFSVFHPSATAFIVWGAVTAVSALLIVLGNETWVVEANYKSSRELYTAFAANPSESAHMALRSKEESIFAYWNEMGIPPIQPLYWALACGTFCIGWLAGKQSGLQTAGEETAEKIDALRKSFGETKRELAEARKELEDARDADGLRERLKEIEERNGQLQRDVRTLEDIRNMLIKDKQNLLSDVEQLEAKLLEEKDSGYREKLLWYEYHGMGNRSARDIARNTGIPKSTVQRWMARQQEGTHDGAVETA